MSSKSDSNIFDISDIKAMKKLVKVDKDLRELDKILVRFSSNLKNYIHYTPAKRLWHELVNERIVLDKTLNDIKKALDGNSKK